MSAPVLATFKPARSYGWVWLLAILLLVAASVLPVFLLGDIPPDERIAIWITIAIMVPLIAFLLVTLASIPAMRYDLTNDELLLSCGPLYRYRVPYAEVIDVRRTTLTPTLWSSMRMPGLALGGVMYADIGTVKMCATRMSRDILLVTAGKRRYGLTPADEAGFMATLAPLLPPQQHVTES